MLFIAFYFLESALLSLMHFLEVWLLNTGVLCILAIQSYTSLIEFLISLEIKYVSLNLVLNDWFKV